MITERIVVDPGAPDPDAIARAALALRRGELVAFPTETVYGLGARADDADAVARVFAAKGRPAWNPLIVHVLDLAAAQELTLDLPPLTELLAARFWPGPLTLVLPRDPARVPAAVSGGGPTVAVRAPAHPVARALIAAAGLPVAAPSANRFQSVSPVTAAHVLKSLGGRIPWVLDGGRCAHGIESTVLDLTRERPTVLRHGAVSVEALRALLPALEVDVATRESATASPGTAGRHYAPDARLVLVAAGEAGEAREALRAEGAGVVAVVRLGEGAGEGLERWLPNDPARYAAGLYDALHAAEDLGAEALVIEAPPALPGWEAVRDRLARAATTAHR
ncbi:MAG: L-threonylcarbamoyladenylate synthase [Polyangiales bacterium]